MEDTKPEDVDYGTGTNIAIEALEGFIQHTPKVDTVVVNLFTLVRNRNRKDATLQQLKQEVAQDLQHFIQTVGSSMTLPNSVIIVYTADYTRVSPKELKRPAIPSKGQYYAACGLVHKEMERPPQSSIVNQATIHWLHIGAHHNPFFELGTHIRSLKNTHKVAMVSHIPVDFHICRMIPFFLLVHSFTGSLVSVQELGDRVFKKPDVPFTIHTHALLGDKELFSSVLSIPDKRKLEADAKEYDWSHHTPEYIKDRLVRLGLLVPGQTYPLIGRL